MKHYISSRVVRNAGQTKVYNSCSCGWVVQAQSMTKSIRQGAQHTTEANRKEVQ